MLSSPLLRNSAHIFVNIALCFTSFSARLHKSFRIGLWLKTKRTVSIRHGVRPAYFWSRSQMESSYPHASYRRCLRQDHSMETVSLFPLCHAAQTLDDHTALQSKAGTSCPRSFGYEILAFAQSILPCLQGWLLCACSKI